MRATAATMFDAGTPEAPCLLRAAAAKGPWACARPAPPRAPARERAQGGRESLQGRGAPGAVGPRAPRERRGRAGERRRSAVSAAGLGLRPKVACAG